MPTMPSSIIITVSRPAQHRHLSVDAETHRCNTVPHYHVEGVHVACTSLSLLSNYSVHQGRQTDTLMARVPPTTSYLEYLITCSLCDVDVGSVRVHLDGWLMPMPTPRSMMHPAQAIKTFL